MPLPEPLAGMGIVIQGTLLVAVHVQSAAVVMLTGCAAPAAGAVIVSGATTALQPLSCDTVNVWPATVIVPLRAAPEFAATANCTVPGPLPLAPPEPAAPEAAPAPNDATAPWGQPASGPWENPEAR